MDIGLIEEDFHIDSEVRCKELMHHLWRFEQATRLKYH